MTIRIPLLLTMALGLGGLCAAPTLAQIPVPLQNGTADFSQTGFSPAKMIDGITADNSGWAIDNLEGANHTAVFETVSNVGGPGASNLTFTLIQSYNNSSHLLGRFRLSLTTDNRSTFADGLASGGAVNANWTVLNPSTAASVNGSTLTINGDGSVLSSGASPLTDIYTIVASTNLANITGVRLEALTDPTLPFNGPGRQPINGNFVVSEFSVGITAAATPEPGSFALLIGMTMTGAGLMTLRRRKAQKPA